MVWHFSDTCSLSGNVCQICEQTLSACGAGAPLISKESIHLQTNMADFRTLARFAGTRSVQRVTVPTPDRGRRKRPDFMFRVPDTIRSAETPDGAVLLDVHHGQMFCLNVVGAKILELMRRGYDESRIADEISRDYGVNQDVVRADVLEFIETLQKHHLLQPGRPANAG